MNKYRESLLESHRESEWDDAHGCFTVARIVKLFNVKIMAEIGIGVGHSAAEVLALNQVKRYYMVDNWASEDNFLKIRNNFQDECVKIIREDSMTAIDKIDNGSLDMVYIDAGYTYRHVLEDVRGWYEKLRIGGILLGDGYNHPNHCGVKQAVHRMFSRECVNVNMSNDSIYWVFKEEK